MRRGILLSIALLALVAAAEEPSASFDDDSAPYDDEETAGGEGFLDASPQWRELVGRLQRSVDADGLLRARRWGNIANGALLAATGPITFIVSVFGLKLSNIMLSLYVTAFGGLLAGIELGAKPIAPWVRSNLQYLATAPGRTALLAFLGGLTWPLGRMGLVPALLTCFNALFNANFAQLLAFVSADDGSQPQRTVGGDATGAASAADAAWADEAAAAAEEAAVQAGAAAALKAAEAAQRAQKEPPAPAAGAEETEEEQLLREALEAARAQKGVDEMS